MKSVKLQKVAGNTQKPCPVKRLNNVKGNTLDTLALCLGSNTLNTLEAIRGIRWWCAWAAIR
jgi:hypothetical protein